MVLQLCLLWGPLLAQTIVVVKKHLPDAQVSSGVTGFPPPFPLFLLSVTEK